jgi:tetratricopeptide repeat protein
MVLIGNVWMELTNGNYWDEYSEIKNDQQAERELPKGMNQKYYLTTWNNTAMIQTGHSSGASTEDERKVLANTLFYLKQLTKKTEVLDNSARDIADPNKVEGISTIVNENNNTSVKFRKPEDNRK